MNGFTAVLRKELTQMMRDRITLVFSIAIPVFEPRSFSITRKFAMQGMNSVMTVRATTVCTGLRAPSRCIAKSPAAP